jgi:hypothetical protein
MNLQHKATMVANASSALRYGLHSSDTTRTPSFWSTTLALSLAYIREVLIAARLVSFAKNVGGYQVPGTGNRQPWVGGAYSLNPTLANNKIQHSMPNPNPNLPNHWPLSLQPPLHDIPNLAPDHGNGWQIVVRERAAEQSSQGGDRERKLEPAD